MSQSKINSQKGGSMKRIVNRAGKQTMKALAILFVNFIMFLLLFGINHLTVYFIIQFVILNVGFLRIENTDDSFYKKRSTIISFLFCFFFCIFAHVVLYHGVTLLLGILINAALMILLT